MTGCRVRSSATPYVASLIVIPSGGAVNAALPLAWAPAWATAAPAVCASSKLVGRWPPSWAVSQKNDGAELCWHLHRIDG